MNFQTAAYGTFQSHKSRRHSPHTLTDFISGIVKTTTIASSSLHDSFTDSQDGEVAGTSPDCKGQHKAHQSVTEQQLGAALLKLEYLLHVSGTPIDVFFYKNLTT